MSGELQRQKQATVQVRDLEGLMRLQRSGEFPEMLEVRAAADAKYGDAALFVDAVNKLKHKMQAEGYHVRISSEEVRENVWLFRYRPSKALLARKALEAEEADDHLRKCIAAGLANEPLPPRIRGGTTDQVYWVDEVERSPAHQAYIDEHLCRIEPNPWWNRLRWWLKWSWVGKAVGWGKVR